MDGMQSLGRMLMVLGGLLFVVGLLVSFGPRIPWLGRLPGDILYRRGGFTFYFPLATSILLSLLLTLLLALFRR